MDNKGIIKTNVTDASQEEIQARICTIRGEQVMLDRDLSMFYGVETRRINEQVKRNKSRFPEDFCFQLTKDEWESLRPRNATINKTEILISQNATSNRGGVRKLPYAFTEPGVGQLSSVLKSKTADEVSVRIQRAFVAMRRFLTANAGLFQRVETLEYRQAETEKKLDVVLDKLEELSPAVTSEQLFATGCVWDAYSYVCDLVRSADHRIVLIDNFVDDRTLKILDKRSEGVEAIVYTRFTEHLELDFAKHNRQYPIIRKVQLPQKEHDRFLIIDDTVYILGDSLKNLGHSLTTVLKTTFTAEDVLEKL